MVSPNKLMRQLPGENGFHVRDGSLIKRKREQWEREKAEAEESKGWFDQFGKKHTPGRRTAAKAAERWESERRHEQEEEGKEPQGQMMAKPKIALKPNDQQHLDGSSPHQQPQQIIFCPHSPMTSFPQQFVPMPLFTDYVSSNGQFANSPAHLRPLFPLSAAYPSPTFIDTTATSSFVFPQQKVFMHLSGTSSSLPTPPISCTSSVEDPDNSPTVNREEGLDNASIVQQMAQETEVDQSQHHSFRRRSSTHSSCSWEEELARQVAERQMAVEREVQLAREEDSRRTAEQVERARKEHESREREERRRTNGIEIRDQHERECLASIQRAEREAALFKKAKLFRHILLDGDADPHTAAGVLKCADAEMVETVLRQLRETERQRRMENNSKGPARGNSPSGTRHNSTSGSNSLHQKEKRNEQQESTNIRLRGRDDAQTMIGKQQESQTMFIRSRSWNVKHSGTIPVHISLPVPIQHKQQQQEFTKARAKKAEEVTNRTSFAVPTLPKKQSGEDISANSVLRTAGLFGQVTLRQRGQNAKGRVMTVAPEEQRQKDEEANRERPAEGCLLSADVSPPSNSPPGSSRGSSCSAESASVVKFRALLNNPLGSRDDPPCPAASEFLPPRPYIAPLRGPTGAQTSISPFRNKTNKSGENGAAKHDYGLQFGDQSAGLRSPTMKRLQESVQSLAEAETNNGSSGSDSARDIAARTDGTKSRAFHCRSSQYRSLNLKRETQRQKQILEHLAQVRAQLKSSQAQLERTISRQNVAEDEQL